MADQSSLYTYTDRNLLERPEFYMYASYGSKSFLRDYFSSRTHYVKMIGDHYLRYLQNSNVSAVNQIIQILSAWRPLVNKLGADFSKKICSLHDAYLKSSDLDKINVEFSSSHALILNLDNLEKISTQQTLRALLLAIVNTDGTKDDCTDIIYSWFSRFLKSFEVTKRLYSTYTPTMRKLSNNFTNITNYSMLSLGLILLYEQTRRLKMLNNSLKLNDLLCSTQINMEQPEDLFLTFLALHREMQNVRSLLDAKEILI